MSLLAGIAVLRFPDTMSRIHAATKPQVLGIMLLMLGVGSAARLARRHRDAGVDRHPAVRHGPGVRAPDGPGGLPQRQGRRAEQVRRAGRESAADDGPAQMAQALADENADGKSCRDPGAPDGNFGRMSEINDFPMPTSQILPGSARWWRPSSACPAAQDRLGRSVAGRAGSSGTTGRRHAGAHWQLPTSTGTGDEIARDVLVERLEVRAGHLSSRAGRTPS